MEPTFRGLNLSDKRWDKMRAISKVIVWSVDVRWDDAGEIAAVLACVCPVADMSLGTQRSSHLIFFEGCTDLLATSSILLAYAYPKFDS